MDYKLAFQQAMYKMSNFASLPKQAYEPTKPEPGEPPKKRRKAEVEVAIMDDVRMQIAKQKSETEALERLLLEQGKSQSQALLRAQHSNITIAGGVMEGMMVSAQHQMAH